MVNLEPKLNYMEQKFKRGLLVGTVLGGLAAFFATGERTKQWRSRMMVELNELFETVKSRIDSLEELTREKYDELVEKAIDEYGEKKEMSVELKNRLSRELMNRWQEIQIYYLYLKLKSRLKGDEISRTDFYKAAEKVYDEYTESKSFSRTKADQIMESLKDKWNEFKKERNL